MANKIFIIVFFLFLTTAFVVGTIALCNNAGVLEGLFYSSIIGIVISIMLKAIQESIDL